MTTQMRRAGTAANDGIVSDIYRAMLAAAPQPPSAQADAVEELAALARFGAACLIASREDLCDLDAGWLQDVAEATGCLAREERAEPCGAECRCAEEVDSFPTQCLRAPDRLWRLAAALDAGKEAAR